MKPTRQLVGVALGLLGAACTDSPVSAPLRALQSSGPVSFVCLDAPGATPTSLPLDACPTGRTGAIDDYSIPHLYALITQPNSAEVAVVDLTTDNNAVLDQDPNVPGANFLPVGALPSDIVSTPGGMASFVTAREARYEGIYALPSDMIRGGAPRLTSWPACALPAAPGEIELVLDAADDDGNVRPSCDAGYGDAEPDTARCEGELHCHGDLSLDALAAGKPGRYKLLVTLPSEGGIAIVDAQSVLDGEPGERPACVIERWVPLEVKIPGLPPPPEPPPNDACVPITSGGDLGATAFQAVPAGITLDQRRAYIADVGAPVIHRIDLPTPCEPRELSPLVTRAAEDPLRPVFTSRVALSPLTLDLKRFLYAIDQIDGSIMVYDVSDDADSSYPLERTNAVWNPFQPTDRIRFGAPPRDIVIVQHQNDETNDTTGATQPVRCDPDPDATGPGTDYRTSTGYDRGAGPRKLRGLFAFAVLESGDIVVIDVDDYDGACRGPTAQSSVRGCEEPFAEELESTDEFSCQIVAPHQPRSSSYLLQADGIADNEPGLVQFPILFDADGAVLQLGAGSGQGGASAEGPPRMRAVTDADHIVVGSDRKALDAAGLPGDTSEHVLAMNLEDPRAHILDQSWTVTYEGAIPGFAGRFAELVGTASGFELRDAGSSFCTRGVRSRNAIEATLLAEGLSTGDAASRANREADFVQIFSESPVETDPYWSGQNECTFLACNTTYGTRETPTVARDLRVVEATEDQLMLVPRNTPAAGAPELQCCYPGVVEFRVRGGEQWIVLGSEVGLLHNMTVADDGTCRPSCDPNLARLNGRALSTPADTVVAPGDPGAFTNPFFRFGINANAPRRNMRFELATQSAFQPLTMTVVRNDPDVQPMSIRLLPPTGELVVSDGSLEGITLLDLNSLVITRQYN